MALSNRRWQRLTTLCALYVAQGVPWGFMAIALVAFLTARGVTDEQAGELTALVLLPWTFKLIWAPLIDSVTIRSMGKRRPWIILAELMMAVTLLGMLALGDLTQELQLLGWMFFLHNCFASLQDVCTDAMAVDVLPFNEQAQANGLMWGSKLIGKGAGAAVFAWIMVEWGFSAAVLLQFVLLLAIMLFPLMIVERPGERRFPWSRGAAVFTEETRNVRNPKEIVRDLFRGFSLQATFVFVLFTVVKLVASGVNEIVTKTLYTQQLGWDAVEFSRVAGLYAIAPILAGAAAGGFLANRFGRRTIITVGFGGYAATACAFALCRDLWTAEWFATSYLLVTEGFLTMGSVGFLSMAMRITWTKSAATMFTVYMTLSNVGHVVGNKLAGPVRGHLNYAETFWFVALGSLLPLLLLLRVDPAQVDVWKFARPEVDAEERPHAVAATDEPQPTATEAGAAVVE